MIKFQTIEHKKRALKNGRKLAASRSSSKQSELSEAFTKRTDIKLYCMRAVSGSSTSKRIKEHFRTEQVLGDDPYGHLTEAKRHAGLEVGDVCLLNHDNKVRGTYRLC